MSVNGESNVAAVAKYQFGVKSIIEVIAYVRTYLLCLIVLKKACRNGIPKKQPNKVGTRSL